jgi:hypothetical protein
MPISLPAELIETRTMGGQTTDTMDAVAVSVGNIDFLNHLITIRFDSGTPSSNAFSASSGGRQYTLTLDTVGGAWSDSKGATGVLPPANLANIVDRFRMVKNDLETMANAVGLIPGAMNAWT